VFESISVRQKKNRQVAPTLLAVGQKEMKCGLRGRMRTELAITRQCKKLKIPTKMDGLKPNKITANYPNITTYILVQTNELTKFARS